DADVQVHVPSELVREGDPHPEDGERGAHDEAAREAEKPDARGLADYGAGDLAARRASGAQQRELAAAVERDGDERLGQAESRDDQWQHLERARKAEGPADGVLVIGVELALG